MNPCNCCGQENCKCNYPDPRILILESELEAAKAEKEENDDSRRELISRLNICNEELRIGNGLYAKLTDKVNDLEAEIEQVKTHHRYDLEQFRKCQDENKRLREALEKIVRVGTKDQEPSQPGLCVYVNLEAEIAESALSVDSKPSTIYLDGDSQERKAQIRQTNTSNPIVDHYAPGCIQRKLDGGKS